MNKTVKTLLVVGTLSCASHSFAVKPATQGTGLVVEADVGSSGGVPTIVVRNTSINKQLSAVKLTAQNTALTMQLQGSAKCGGIDFDSLGSRTGNYFKSARIGVGINAPYWSVNAGQNSDINDASHTVTKNLQVPVTAFNGTPYAIDAAAYIMNKANQQGANKLAFLQQDHTYSVQVPIYFDAVCQRYERNKIKKTTSLGSEKTIKDSEMIAVHIKYQGDKNLTGTMNAQISQNNMQGGINAGPQNFIQVNSGKFLTGVKDLKGTCPLEPEFTIQLNGAGDGQVKIRINDGSSTVHDSQAVAFSKGKAQYTFSEKIGYPGSNQLNKPYAHNYRLFVKTKTNNQANWPSSWTPVAGTGLQWTHTCIKEVKVNPMLQGGMQNQLKTNQPAANPSRAIPGNPPRATPAAPLTPTNVRPVSPVKTPLNKTAE